MLRNTKLSMNDLPTFLEIRNECADNLHDNRRFTLMQALEWWKKNWDNGTYASFGHTHYWKLYLDNAAPKSDHTLAMIGYVRIQGDPKNEVVTVGVDIHKDYRRKGYASEAYQLLFKEYFDRLGYNRMELEVLADNAPAIMLYKKLGFVEEGVRLKAIYRPNKDEYIDSIMMSMLKVEWEKRNENL